MQMHGPRGDTAEEDDDDPQVANLLQRYPEKTADEVRDALRQCDGHAGKAARRISLRATHHFLVPCWRRFGQ